MSPQWSRDTDLIEKTPNSSAEYYAQMAGQTVGPYRVDQLRSVPGFTLQTPLRLNSGQEWKPAFTVVDLRAYFNTAKNSNAWVEAAAKAEKQRSRQVRLEKLSGFVGGIKAFFRTIAYLVLLACLACAGAYYLTISGRIRPITREYLIAEVHSKIQQAVQKLNELDHRYIKRIPVVQTAAPPAPLPPVFRTSVALPVSKLPVKKINVPAKKKSMARSSRPHRAPHSVKH